MSWAEEWLLTVRLTDPKGAGRGEVVAIVYEECGTTTRRHQSGYRLT